MYIRLAFFAESQERLNLLQEFDVLSVIVRELEWNELLVDLVKDCLETMRLITSNPHIPGVVLSIFSEAELKATNCPFGKSI